MIGVQAAACAPFPASLRGGRAGRGRLGADDRRRDRGQAPGRADAGADRPLGRRDRGRRRGRGRRGDGVPAGARQARGRGRRRGRRGGAARRAGSGRRRRRDHGGRAVGRERRRRAAGRDGAPPREPGRPAAGAAGARCPTGPGRWRGCSRWSASCGANLLDVEHIREGFDLHVRETAVQLVLETRGPEHAGGGRTRGGLRRARGYAETAACVAVVARRLLDQRADHAAALVGLGVPLDAEHEPAVRAPRSPRAARRATSSRSPSRPLADRRRRPGGGGTWCRAAPRRRPARPASRR